MSWRKDTADGVKGIGYGLVLAVVAGVCILVLGFMWVFGAAFFSRHTAETRGQTSVRERTVANGAYRIAAYEHFYDQCASVQSMEARINNALQELKTNPAADRRAIIDANLTAYRNQRMEAINIYNADARKTETQAKFLASDLPYQLDPNAEATTCHA